MTRNPFNNRSVIELMVLWFTLIVGVTVIGLSTAVVWVLIAHPDTNVDRLTATLMSLLSSMLGALLGLLAGRASVDDSLHTRPDQDADSLS